MDICGTISAQDGGLLDLKHAKQKIIVAIFAVSVAVLLSGCLRITADELYSLPQVSEEYRKLQRHINAILNQGAEFSPPASGPNRQAVQLEDLNGDGKNEVIAFFTIPSDSTLKVYIFERIDNDYAVAEIIEGVGSEIDSVRYVDMDGDGIMEIVIGWKMGDTLKQMSIYSIKDFQSVVLARTEYTGITVYDLNGNGNDDIIAFRLPTAETVAVAEVLTLMPDGEIVKAETRLSIGIEKISRVLTGKLNDGIPAIFIESEGKYDKGVLVTDICIYQNGGFTNISLRKPSGISDENVREFMQSSDINKDGIIKVPAPRLLKAQSETAYYAIDWYTFSSSGNSRLALTTYHNNTDEWFLIFPFNWREMVSVRRDDAVSGERTIIFSYITGNDRQYEDFLKIYRLTGDKAQERAALPERVILLSEGNAIYAFELLAPPNSFGLSYDEALIKANFRLIYTDWLAGTS